MTTSTFQLDIQPRRSATQSGAAASGVLPALFAALKARVLAVKQPLSPADEAGREADKVRRLADSYAQTDPGFAADLYAAAARHEALEG